MLVSTFPACSFSALAKNLSPILSSTAYKLQQEFITLRCNIYACTTSPDSLVCQASILSTLHLPSGFSGGLISQKILLPPALHLDCHFQLSRITKLHQTVVFYCIIKLACGITFEESLFGLIMCFSVLLSAKISNQRHLLPFPVLLHCHFAAVCMHIAPPLLNICKFTLALASASASTGISKNVNICT